MKEYYLELMLENTDFTEDEIYEMEAWEIQEHLGL